MLRNFLGGNAVFAFFDVPWMPIYFALIFILHPDLGLVAVFGGIMVFVLGFLTERFTRKRLESATMLNTHASNFLGATMRNASIVRSMEMCIRDSFCCLPPLDSVVKHTYLGVPCV